MTVVHIVLPGDIDDPATPSGGNVYDRRVCDGLSDLGWQVQEHPVPGSWPTPSAAQRAELAEDLATIPDDAAVLIDGLVASAVPEILFPESERLRLIVLVHMPLEDADEGKVLTCAQAVITTSEWTRDRLLSLYPLLPDRLHVATPGVDVWPVASGSPSGRELLCVAAVTLHKGHDVLADALAMIGDLSWTCVCVGSLTREPDLVRQLSGRLRFTGPLTGRALAAAYAKADLLVLPSRGETYGMVVTEALARGIPVLATNAKGIPEALGRAPDGSLPGILTEPGDAAALATALRGWLTDADIRERLRVSARARRLTLTDWHETVSRIGSIICSVTA